jgi:hypothetical protein
MTLDQTELCFAPKRRPNTPPSPSSIDGLQHLPSPSGRGDLSLGENDDPKTRAGGEGQTSSADKAKIELLDDLLHWLTQADDWLTARDLCKLMDLPPTEAVKRKLRKAADTSDGAIAGGQKGYKLIRHMTVDEYNHWRNWMTHQADAMRHRVIQSDKHFYTRKPI